MNNLNAILLPAPKPRVSIPLIMLYSTLPNAYRSNNKDQLEKDARIIIADRYKNTTKYNIKKDPMEISADWCKSSRFFGKTLWVKVATLLCKDLNELYIKNKTTKFAIASAMLHPHVSVYNKLHKQFQSIRPRD